MTTDHQNMPSEYSTFDKHLELGPLDYTYTVWLIILFVFVAVYVYFTRYYGQEPSVLMQDKGYYYY
jgi:uncharacterized membrane protein YobD (UPF0266 family)